MPSIILSKDIFFKMGMFGFMEKVEKQYPTKSNLLIIDVDHIPEVSPFPEETKIDTIIFVIEHEGDKFLINESNTQCIRQFYKIRFILRKSSFSELKKFMITATWIQSADYFSIKHYKFTSSEKKVLSMFAAGLNVSSISYNCNISPKTVSCYKRKIMRKINVNSSLLLFRKIKINRSVEHVLSTLPAESDNKSINVLLLNGCH